MGVLDMLARAETSSDLQHHEYDCAVDVLGATGMATARDFVSLSLYRLKYLNDTAEIEQCKATFIRWAYRSMQNRKIDPKGASRIGVQALTAWIGDVCNVCQGRKYKRIEGSPALSDRPCDCCGGTGKNQIRAHGDMRDVMLDVAERADAAILALNRGVDDRLGRG